MPKVMTIGSLKDALPAGAFQGPIGKLIEGSPKSMGLSGLNGGRGLGYACAEFGYVTRTRTMWKCPAGKGKTRASRAKSCRKALVKTRELVCLGYDAKLSKPGVTSSHKRAAVCKSPKRKLRAKRRR